MASRITNTPTINRNAPDHREAQLQLAGPQVAQLDGIAESWFIHSCADKNPAYGRWNVANWGHGPARPSSGHLWTFDSYNAAIAAIANTISQAQQQNGYNPGPDLATVHTADLIAPAGNIEDVVITGRGITLAVDWRGTDGWSYSADFFDPDDQGPKLRVRATEPDDDDGDTTTTWYLPAGTDVLELLVLGDDQHRATHTPA